MLLPPHVPNLKKFITQRRVLKLYKAFFYATKLISNKVTRREVQDWIREDFKSKKNETNDDAINMYLTQGEKSLNELIKSIKNTQPNHITERNNV